MSSPEQNYGMRPEWTQALMGAMLGLGSLKATDIDPTNKPELKRIFWPRYFLARDTFGGLMETGEEAQLIRPFMNDLEWLALAPKSWSLRDKEESHAELAVVVARQHSTLYEVVNYILHKGLPSYKRFMEVSGNRQTLLDQCNPYPLTLTSLQQRLALVPAPVVDKYKAALLRYTKEYSWRSETKRGEKRRITRQRSIFEEQTPVKSKEQYTLNFLPARIISKRTLDCFAEKLTELMNYFRRDLALNPREAHSMAQMQAQSLRGGAQELKLGLDAMRLRYQAGIQQQGSLFGDTSVQQSYYDAEDQKRKRRH